MAKKNKKQPTVKKKAEAIKPKSTSTLFNRIEAFFEKRHHLVAWIITGVSLLMSFMMFDAKISMGLDDSTYIQEGWKYSKDFFGHFFTSQAPFYAMVLALPISIFGINLVVLKGINVLFFVASIYLFYRAFRYRISWLVLFASLLIFATNTEALRIASLTYTEALYLLIQSLFLWSSLTLISKLDTNQSWKNIFQKHWGILLTTSIIFCFLYLTRTVGIATFLIFPIYYALNKQWKGATFVTGFMLVIYVLFGQVKNAIWEDTNQFSTQAKILSQKNAYDESEGYEDVSGFITRMLENTNQFFSARFFEITGFRDYPAEWNWGLTFFIILPLVIALVWSVKLKKSTLLFTALYIGAICGFSFLGMQTSWGQARYIMILLGPIFILLFWFIERLFSKENTKGYQFIAVLIIGTFVLSNLMTSVKKAEKNIPIAKANLIKGDRYMGFTPDWINYLKLSEWCADSLDQTDFVACRKAPMSFIYSGGKEFYPIWSVPTNNDPDTTLAKWKELGITHVIVGNLRVNALTSTNGIINTVHRILQPIQDKYPNKLELLRKEGEYEEAVLIKINYDK